jgi:ADP-heptose:LPS heptosyltransferase
MKKIVISPFSKQMRNGLAHPKNYPYWKELISILKEKGYSIIQIGTSSEEILTEDVRFNLSFKELRDLLYSADLFISVDNFLPHFANHYGCNKGIVIFSQSDPNIFGYKQNINILKDRKYLRENQFWFWEQCDFIKDAFVSPEIVANKVELAIH